MDDQLSSSEVPAPEKWEFRLYIVGQSPKSVLATANLRKICEHYLDGRLYEIHVIDLMADPHLAEADQVIVIPTLVRLFPEPSRRVFGDLSNTEKVVAGLQLQAV